MRQAKPSLTDEVFTAARRYGMHAVGVAEAVPLTWEFERYEEYVAAGRYGDMTYVAANPAARRDVSGDEILPGARSVVVCAISYARTEGADEPTGPAGATIARYARGLDYHGFFRRKLRLLAAWLRRRVPGSVARPMADTAPVLERAWAQRAGVGFIGKNGCVIVPGLGSFVLLGEIATTVPLTPTGSMASRCGECRLCLDHCPTRAFDAPYVLEPRRCISYLTIEHDGPIDPPFRESIGDRLFGCDDCQDVCPYNRAQALPPAQTERFALDKRWQAMDVGDIANLDDAAFIAATAATPLRRPRREGLVRNAAIVMGNSRERRHLPVLQQLAARDGSPVVRDAAQWAVERIGRAG